MKLKTTLLVITLAAFAAPSAFAAEGYPTDDTGWKAEPAKATKAEAKKPVKRHSHAEEKSGMPMPQHADKNAVMKRKDMHDHTKDRH